MNIQEPKFVLTCNPHPDNNLLDRFLSKAQSDYFNSELFMGGFLGGGKSGMMLDQVPWYVDELNDVPKEPKPKKTKRAQPKHVPPFYANNWRKK